MLIYIYLFKQLWISFNLYFSQLMYLKSCFLRDVNALFIQKSLLMLQGMKPVTNFSYCYRDMYWSYFL